jgi:hypothetical protein
MALGRAMLTPGERSRPCLTVCPLRPMAQTRAALMRPGGVVYSWECRQMPINAYLLSCALATVRSAFDSGMSHN